MLEELDPVWKALSSAIRRSMLDMLRDGPKTTGALATAFPDLSRFAVMQHLGVLEAAELVLVRREGRQRFNYLNAVPIQRVYERWVNPLVSHAAKATTALERHLELGADKRRMEHNADASVRFHMEARFAATPEQVYKAVTEEIDNWWPHRFKPDGKVVCENRLMGKVYEDWGNGHGALYGVIVWLEPGRKVVTSGPSALNNGMSSFNTETMEPDGDGTIYKKELVLWGVVPPEMEPMFTSGIKTIIEKALKGYLEEGKRYEGAIQ
ncbi:MAG: helix-turn-helix domain-containing protein [Armatimonadetes bacterium]|nr:helix-turn-helix domain-containing protein [Armatimonadota bacterium]